LDHKNLTKKERLSHRYKKIVAMRQVVFLRSTKRINRLLRDFSRSDKEYSFCMQNKKKIMFVSSF